jgi:hypothetical protein
MPNPPLTHTDIAISLTGARCRKFALIN